MSEAPDPFRVLRFRRAPLRQDGTERRTNYVVDVEVDGAVHEVRIRQSGAAHLPQGLKGHPHGPEIKKAVFQAILDPMLRRIEELRKEGRLPPRQSQSD
jgi:hypothetical protein